MILKILLFLLALFAVYLIFFKKSREQQVKQNDKNKEEMDIMVECPTCKVFVSKKEAILSNGRYFCSKECLK